MKAFVALILAILAVWSAPARAQSPASSALVLLESRALDGQSGDIDFDVSKAAGAYRAIRLRVASGSVSIVKVTIVYAGLPDYAEVRSFALAAGERTREIGATTEPRFIDRVRVTLGPGSVRQRATLEILGLQRPEDAALVPVSPPSDIAGRDSGRAAANRNRAARSAEERDKTMMRKAAEDAPEKAAATIAAAKQTDADGRLARAAQHRRGLDNGAVFGGVVAARPSTSVPGRSRSLPSRTEGSPGQVSPPPPAPAPASAEPSPTPSASAACADPTVCVPVKIFFGTDRQRSDLPKRIAFGKDRAEATQLGNAIVTVPLATARKRGEINRPSWLDVNVWRVPPEGDPKRHFTIPEGGVSLYASEADFVAAMRNNVQTAGTYKSHAFIFVHGYNTSFDDALYRTAQIAYDLGDDSGPFGTAFLYSWPSAGQLAGYGYDEESARFSVDHLVQFVKLVATKSGAEHVHVIAHSMGNAVLLSALGQLAAPAGQAPLIDQLILAAPDYDARQFGRIAADIGRVARATTLYASSRDVALQAARKFRLGEPRAGDVTKLGPTIAPGIESIDISALSTDIFGIGHAEYADKKELLNDMGLLFRKSEHPPDTRNLNYRRQGKTEHIYWRYEQ